MRRTLLIAIVALGVELLYPVAIAKAADPSVGRTLVTIANTSTTELIELDGTVVQSWNGTAKPASLAYLLDDGSIVRPSRYSTVFFSAGGVGGRIQTIDSQNNVVWDYILATEQYQQHHDIEPMPNGNVLAIAWERRTSAEAAAAGRTGPIAEMWPTYIVELEPTSPTTANFVWEWRFWDHLIQDADPAKPNFGVVAEHPERLDINFGAVGNGDWVHANSIDYDPINDQILFSSRALNEVYVIDHSTTTAEAAGSTGGLSGKGGDLLYRWGNPQAYDRGAGTDQYLRVVHGANWIDPGLPGEGNILLFNNGDRPGSSNDYSTAVELVPPQNPDGTYELIGSAPYGPASPSWTYGDPGEFYGGPTQCGAFRLPNGNTLVSLASTSQILEVTTEGEIVWTHTVAAGINRAQRYSDSESSGVNDLGADNNLELLSTTPNPFRTATTLRYRLSHPGEAKLSVFSISGEKVVTLFSGWLPAGEQQVNWDGRDRHGELMASGIYLARLVAHEQVAVRTLVLRK